MTIRKIAIPTQVAAAAALAIFQLSVANAQTSNDTLKLDEVVVTGTATGVSKMKQSSSISTVGSEQILQGQPTNASDILRSIPGIRAESSGGGGNANVTVRGLPISAGGSRYVQFQEDGLPVMLFGDVAFQPQTCSFALTTPLKALKWCVAAPLRPWRPTRQEASSTSSARAVMSLVEALASPQV